MEWRGWACSFVQGWLGQTAPLQYYALIGKEMGQIGIMQWNMLLLSSRLVRKTTQNSFIWSFFSSKGKYSVAQTLSHVSSQKMNAQFARATAELIHDNWEIYKEKANTTDTWYYTAGRQAHSTHTLTASVFSMVAYLPHIKNKFIQSQFGKCLVMQGKNTIWAQGIVDCSSTL